MPPELLVDCLGRLNLGCRDSAEAEPRALPLPATLKAQSLLAYLVVNRRSLHTRDQLAGLFWGDRPDHNARRSLATALWQIRRCLPSGDFIDAGVATVAFNPDSACRLDVAEFEQLLFPRASADTPALARAVDLYRGPFLDGFYDDWVLNERYRLEGMYCEALAQLMAARESLGEHEAALAVALRLLEQDPLREDAHRAAMRAYCRLGNRPAALAQYACCEQALDAELGAPPMRETAALRAAILGGQFEIRRVPVSVPGLANLATQPEPGQDPFDPALQAPLVGRARELQFLAGGWQAALAGRCRLLLVSGESGVGKTRLVREFAGPLRWQDVCVLEGHCYEFERLLPYQPLVEALESLPTAQTRAALASLPGWVIAEVARLAPGFSELVSDSPYAFTPTPGAGLTQERLFEGVTRFLAHAALQRPLLLIVENLHWATGSTLQLLHHLACTVAGVPFLILGTLRVEGVDSAGALATLGRRLEREGIARRLQLEPLSPEMVVDLVSRMSGAGEVARPLAGRLYEETEGNPFYLIQTLKALFEQGAIRMSEGAWAADFAELGRGRLPLPSGVSETLAARVARLSEDARAAVQTAAVAGREFDFELLKEAWGRGEKPTLAALDELLRHRLIVEGAGGASGDYAFTHHKIQEVVYAGLPRHRRCYLHKRVGLAMERWLSETEGARPVELAYHFEQALQLDRRLADRAITYLLQAGRRAERQSANQEALAYYRRGLAIVDSLPEASQRSRREVELLIALGVPTTAVYGYASPEAREVYSRARDLCRQTGDKAPLFTSLVGLARNYGVGGDHKTALGIGRELLALAKTTHDAEMLMEAYRQTGGSAFALGRLDEARAHSEAGLALYDPAYHDRLAYRFGHDPAVTFLGTLGLVLWLQGYGDQALTRSRQLLALLPFLSHSASLTLAHCWLAKHACARGDVAAAQRYAEGAIRLGRANELPAWTALGTILQGWAQVEQGEAAEGLRQMNEGISGWRAAHFQHFMPFALALQAEACLKARRRNEASAALEAACESARTGGDAYWSAEVERLQGELSHSEGLEDGPAEDCFRRAIDIARNQGATMLELRAAVSLARLWQGQGRGKAAGELLAAVCGRFTEGFEESELVMACDLLATLV